MRNLDVTLQNRSVSGISLHSWTRQNRPRVLCNPNRTAILARIVFAIAQIFTSLSKIPSQVFHYLGMFFRHIDALPNILIQIV